jgi:hypothetical protein
MPAAVRTSNEEEALAEAAAGSREMGESWDHRDNHLLDVVPLGVVELALEPRPPRPPARRVLAMGPTGTRGPEPVDLGFLWQRRGVVAEPVDVPLPSIGSDSRPTPASAPPLHLLR